MIAYIDPLTYGVDGLRYCFLGTSALPPIMDLVVLLACCLAMQSLGAYLFETSDVD
jgi:ABC-2 type transport system permease protein